MMRTLLGRAVLGAGVLVVGMLAVTVHGQDIARRAVELDGTDVTHISVTAGALGTVAHGPGTPGAMFYSANGTDYIDGCWGHGGGIGWADELRLVNMPLTGGEIDWYSFRYAMGYGALLGVCVPGSPGAGNCRCYCPVGGGLGCNSPAYVLDVALYDGPPGSCGSGLPIAGTEVQVVSSMSRPLGDRVINMTVDVDPKVTVPGVVWGVVITDQEDAWINIGSAPHIGSSTQDGAFTPWNGWKCWPDPYGWTCPGCTGWMAWSVAGNAQVVFSLVPVPPPAGTKHPGTYTIQKNSLTLDRGDEVVFFEIHVSDFDPKQHGTLLKAWQAGIDAAAGYASGLQGTLAPHFVACTLDPSVCDTQMGPGSVCPFPPTNCPAGYIDKGRGDYIFNGMMELNGVDVSTLNYRYGSALMSPPIGNSAADYYLGTLVLYVPPEAKGTFTIPFLQPDTVLFDSNNEYIPLIGMQPGELTVAVGRCCFGHGVGVKKAGCIEDVTANQCANAGLCKGYCDLNRNILCLSNTDCGQQGAPPGSICVAGATLGQNCFTVLVKPDGKDIDCAGPDICTYQGGWNPVTDGTTCAHPCLDFLFDEDRNVDQGNTVLLNPGGGTVDPTLDALVQIENVSGPNDARVTVREMSVNLHPAAGGYTALGTTLQVDTSLNDGDFLLTIAIPFDATALRARHPLSVDLTWFHAPSGQWQLAVEGNTQDSPANPGSRVGYRWRETGAAPPTINDLHARYLGDYGVFWNPYTQRGFTWANVDHVTDFAAAVPAGGIPTVSDWGIVVITLLLLVGAKVYFGRRRAVRS